MDLYRQREILEDGEGRFDERDLAIEIVFVGLLLSCLKQGGVLVSCQLPNAGAGPFTSYCDTRESSQ